MLEIIQYQCDNQQVLYDVEPAPANIFIKMAQLERRNNKDICCENVTHRQPTSKRNFYRSYNRMVTFNLYFYREDFLIN